MPELPEVETIKNYIKPIIEGDTLVDIKVYNKKLRINIPDNFITDIKDKKVISVYRRAKYIVIDLNDDISILFHFGMTGKITIYDNKPNKNKHDHVIFKLKSNKYLCFNDQRRFGLIAHQPSNGLEKTRFFAHLGIEPLNKEFNGKYLYNITKSKKLAIKNLLMEQKNIVGVGNIYAAEALFLSKIHPVKIANEISLQSCNTLCDNIKLILSKAIAKGGSTIKDYQSADGKAGYFQYEFNVYGRENKPCKACKTTIKRIVQISRSTFYCPKCQKK